MWKEWCERFTLYMRKRNFAERTIIDYLWHLGNFFRYLDSEGITKLSSVTKEAVRGYQTHLYYYENKGKRLSFSTQHTRLCVVRTFFRFLQKEDFLPYDPTVGIELPRRKKNLPRGIMSTRDVGRIFKAASGDKPLIIRDRAILEVLYSTGVRNSELRSLSLFDVDLVNQLVRVKYGKGNKERLIPLGEIASQHVMRYLKEGRPHLTKDPTQTLLFVSVRGRMIDPCSLVCIVKRYIRKAKLSQSITPHCFRHTCASHMLKGKADLRHIQEMLGHASVHTTQIYTKVELSNLKEVHKKCHPRGKLESTH